MYVCLCKAIRDSDVKRALDDGAHSVKCLAQQLGLATDCGRCGSHAKTLIANHMAETASISQ